MKYLPLFCSFLSIATFSIQAQTTIMPLGDSITAGFGQETANGEYPGYRLGLYDDLTGAGDNIQMVGANNPDSAPGTVSHPDGYSPTLYNKGQNYNNGYSGYTSGDILNNLDGNVPSTHTTYSNQGGDWLTGSTASGRSAVSPNIVLLMAGTNDIKDSVSLPTLEANMTDILNWFETNRPSSTLFVATILPQSTGSGETVFASTNATVQTYNTWLKTELDLPAYSNCDLVDMYSLFVNSTDTAVNTGYSYDGTHPTITGYGVIATAWDSAIQPTVVMDAPEPSILLLLLPAGLGLVLFKRFPIRAGQRRDVLSNSW